jgi:hypothetical protein
MVELEFSGMLSMWERNTVMAAPGALCAALYEETACICTSLPRRTNQPLENQGGEMENDQSSTWKLVRQRYNEGRRGERVRFDGENVHHP